MKISGGLLKVDMVVEVNGLFALGNAFHFKENEKYKLFFIFIFFSNACFVLETNLFNYIL